MTDFSYHGNTIYNSVYYIPFLVVFFSEKKGLKRQEKARKKKIPYLYRGRQEIISSLVKYVTAHDRHAIRKSSSGKKSYLTSEIFYSS